MNRLQGVKESNGVLTEYEFDSFGNISREYTLTASGIKTTQYEYDGNNCLLISFDDRSSTRYTYDKSGNLINKTYELSGRETKSWYSYDGYNRLSEYVSGGTVAEYAYNPEGLRESKTVNGNYTRFIYDGANVVGELTNDNYYIYYRGTELISSKSYDNHSHYYRLDSHGSVTDIVNHLGESQKSYAYTPYGKEKLLSLTPSGEQTILYHWQKETDGTHNPFRYCGEYYDEESGLIYLRNRYYDPTTGRFITEDPARDGNNWYVYCGGNPVNFVDPWGLTAVSIRSFTDDYSGATTRNSKTETASFTIAGTTLTTKSTGENDKGIVIWNKNGTLMADDEALYNFFGAVRSSGNGYSNVAFYNKDTEVYETHTQINIIGTKLRYQYVIDEGAIRFDFSQNNYWSALWRGGSKTLARGIYNAAKSINSGYMSGRTTGGLNTELQLHWAGAQVFKNINEKLYKSASTADMGSTDKNGPDYDDNAWFWQFVQEVKNLWKLNVSAPAGIVHYKR